MCIYAVISMTAKLGAKRKKLETDTKKKKKK